LDILVAYKATIMERKDFLKGLGLVSAGSLLPNGNALALNADTPAQAVCTLIPSETRGPYPLPTGTNVSVVTRNNITEGKEGIPLALTVLVQNQSCIPIPNARVDIWQCDKDGYYSGYNNQPGYLGTKNNAGTTFLRGSQTTDSNGQAQFTTIYPGWYTGRVTHIHAEVYISGVLQRTSQFAFPDSLNTTVYTTSALYTPHGTNTITNGNDNVFSDGVSEQLLNISGSVAAGFTTDHTFTINYAALPLVLLSFNARVENGRPAIWWSTTAENNLSRFVIERSTDGKTFVEAGSLAAKNSSGTSNYTFTDTVALVVNYYYRLKMLNDDGSFTYSQVVILRMTAGGTIALFPNPAKNKVQLTHPLADNNSYAEVLALDGRQVAYSKLPKGSTSTTIDVQLLSRGAYLLAFVSSSQRQVVKFIKQ
jgi:protocatechuate 3,4-dioxygenase beta subunit